MRSITEKIDEVTLIAPEYLHSILPAPQAVKIEVSPRCCFSCSFCGLPSRDKQPTVDMDFDLFKRITQEMKDFGVRQVGLFYLGESFMNVGLLTDCIKWCKDIGFEYTFVTTNGALCTKDAVRSVMKAGLDSLKFSVNSFDETQFELIMGAKKKMFYAARENIKGAWEVRKEGGFDCGLYASSIKFDNIQEDQMRAMLDNYILPYVDEHYWLPLYSMSMFATEREEELGYKPTAGNQGRMGAVRDPLPCWTVLTEGHVPSDGGLSSCCFDSTRGWKMADLTKVSFEEGWNCEKFVKLREAHLRKDVSETICKDCIAYS